MAPLGQARVLCLGFFLAGHLAGRSRRPQVVGVGAFASEAAIVALLYAAWQLAGRLSVMHAEGAIDRARWI